MTEIFNFSGNNVHFQLPNGTVKTYPAEEFEKSWVIEGVPADEYADDIPVYKKKRKTRTEMLKITLPRHVKPNTKVFIICHYHEKIGWTPKLYFDQMISTGTKCLACGPELSDEVQTSGNISASLVVAERFNSQGNYRILRHKWDILVTNPPEPESEE